MKKYLYTFLLAIISNFAFSQNDHLASMILKNSSVQNELITNSSLTFLLQDKNFKSDCDIDKNNGIRMLIEIDEDSLDINIKSTRGYLCLFGLGYATGINGVESDRMKLSVVNGYRFNNYFSLGLGIGLHYDFNIGVPLIPLFGYLKTNILDRNVSPYLSFGIGYTYALESNFEKVGLYFNPSIGIDLNNFEHSSLYIELGYEYQIMESSTSSVYYHLYINQYQTRYTSSNKNYDAISITIGISF